MVRQRQDVLLAFTQGRQRNVNGLKTVEKVPPEGFFLHHVFEISVGRCDQAEIAGGFLCGAHGADALFLKYAQKDLLQRKGKFPHFIKEQRPAVCFGDQAVFTCNRTGEGAAYMPEQQAFGKVLGKGPFWRPLFSWMVRAKTSLPVPVSPLSKTQTSLSAHWITDSRQRPMAAPDPTSLFRFKGVVRWPEEESWAPQRF